MIKYTQTTHGETAFHVPEGMYTVQQLENILKDIKEAEARYRDHLKRAMGTPTVKGKK